MEDKNGNCPEMMSVALIIYFIIISCGIEKTDDLSKFWKHDNVISFPTFQTIFSIALGRRTCLYQVNYLKGKQLLYLCWRWSLDGFIFTIGLPWLRRRTSTQKGGQRLRVDNSMKIQYRAAFQDIDMQSATRVHSVKSKKRELRGAQMESRKKVEKLKEVSEISSHVQPLLFVSHGVKFTIFLQNCLKCISSLEKLTLLKDK